MPGCNFVVSRGFSLIELMVTLAVLALLTLAAMPFSGAWLDGQRQSQLRSALLEGISQARALALRNPHCLQADTEAVRLYYLYGQLRLIQPENSANCTDSPIWPNPEDEGTVPYWRSAIIGGNPQLVYCGTHNGDADPAFYLGFNTRALSTGDCRDIQIGIKVGTQEQLNVDLR